MRTSYMYRLPFDVWERSVPRWSNSRCPLGNPRQYVFDRRIDVQVLRLRRKLEADPSASGVIRTERGIGYVFALPVEPL
jgi:hypothetical protein